MQCPVDNTTLVMSDRQGIEIDYCPQCRGVWLDRGEIDKIIERSVQEQPGRPAPSQPQPNHHQSHDNRREHRDYDDDYHHGHGDHRKKHKESWFGELFD